ncbi:MAG: hypothetical protein M3256_14385 [Actinomycetota bacterium]|nr:hypothetical protein [Actinomycetota bacterium]
MYRLIRPDTPQELPLRMLFQPADSDLFHRACEADSYRCLVAALLDDPAYESASISKRLDRRVRMAEDLVLIAKVDGRQLEVLDRDGPSSINIHSDGEFIHSLEQTGFVSLAPRE